MKVSRKTHPKTTTKKMKTKRKCKKNFGDSGKKETTTHPKFAKSQKTPQQSD